MIEKVVSGGQTGVDRAALDVAIRLGLPCGGWCPRGRLAEDGCISLAYLLRETPTSDYPERTNWNVRDSDGTLLLTGGPLEGGTAYTIVCAKQHQRPYLVVDLLDSARIEPVHTWAKDHAVKVLNIAGPRESTCPGIYHLAASFLESLLARG